jgi:hypothetical protein
MWLSAPCKQVSMLLFSTHVLAAQAFVAVVSCDLVVPAYRARSNCTQCVAPTTSDVALVKPWCLSMAVLTAIHGLLLHHIITYEQW